ncbi:MAG: zf-HC2 domain-containing protein [Planctomycetes bacterium]|nr:zf-HC2 domain-containing protein [Planctomycetota bacterium]
MGCEEIRDQLPFYAGGESYDSERAAVEAHVAVCAACARELDQCREMRANLATLREGTAPAGTFKSLWSAVRADLFPQKAANRIPWFDAGLRYAAVTLVGIAIGFVIHVVDRREAPHAAPSMSALAPVHGVSPVQPANLTPAPNLPRLFLRPQPRQPAPRVELDGNYYLPRVESMPAGAAKDF